MEVVDGVENNEVVENNEAADTSKSEKVKTQVSEKKYTDEDVNAISLKNTNKAVEKLKKELGIDDVEEAKKILNAFKSTKQDTKTDELSMLKQQAEKNMLEAVNLRIENALLVKGVDSSKSSRMMRLVDKKVILDESGNIDNSKLNTEIEEILKDFPELSKKSEEKGFTIGGDGKETEKEKVDPLDKLKKAMKLK